MPIAKTTQRALAKNEVSFESTGIDFLIQYLEHANARALLPEALYTRACVELARGSIDNAHRSLLRAREIGESLNARRTLWQIYAALAQIEQQRGDADAARLLRAQAREVVEYIAEHTPAELRESFLNLPDVRAIMGS